MADALDHTAWALNSLRDRLAVASEALSEARLVELSEMEIGRLFLRAQSYADAAIADAEARARAIVDDAEEAAARILRAAGEAADALRRSAAAEPAAQHGPPGGEQDSGSGDTDDPRRWAGEGE
ncbi:MAG: hypothetical protein ACYDA2_07175 [Acidimicrobiales bacterium]